MNKIHFNINYDSNNFKIYSPSNQVSFHLKSLELMTDRSRSRDLLKRYVGFKCIETLMIIAMSFDKTDGGKGHHF